MSTHIDARIDPDRLNALLGQAVVEFGAAVNAALVVIGDRLGLYRALAAAGPLLPAELAQRTGTAERYVREWLGAQAASGFAGYDPDSGTYALSPEQAAAFADESSPAFVGGGFQVALGAAADVQRIQDAFLTGQRVGWHEHGNDVFEGCGRFFEPGYRANLPSSWIPALDCVHNRLQTGGRVADVGCGRGASTIIIAEGYPSSAVIGSTTTRTRSHTLGAEPTRLASPTGCASKSPTPTDSPARATTWSPASTACTTWAIRSPSPVTSAARSPTGRG
jgi:Rv2258c-like winged HTH domain